MDMGYIMHGSLKTQHLMSSKGRDTSDHGLNKLRSILTGMLADGANSRVGSGDHCMVFVFRMHFTWAATAEVIFHVFVAHQ